MDTSDHQTNGHRIAGNDVIVHGTETEGTDVKPGVVSPLLDDDATVVKVRSRSKSWGRYKHALKRLIPVRRNKTSDECPFERVGLFSMLAFHWIQPLMWKIYKRGLRDEDIWPCPPTDTALENARRLGNFWHESLTRCESVTLWSVMWRMYRTRIITSSLCFCMHVIISFVGPAFVLRELLSGLENRTFTLSNGLLFAFLLTLVEILRTLSNSIFFSLNYQTGIRIQSAVTTLTYDKILRLRHLHNKSAGDFVNLFSSDGHRLFNAVPSGLHIISGPLITVISLIYLLIIIGPTVLIGFSVILLFYPLQILLSRLINTYRVAAVKIADHRIRLMNEILTHVKLIKMYAWEPSFAMSVHDIRADERHILERAQFMKSLLMTLVPSIPTVAVVLTLITHTQLGYPLTVAEAFTLLAVFNCVRPKLGTVPSAVHALTEGKIAADRFERILRMEEAINDVRAPADPTLGVVFNSASFGWDILEENEQKDEGEGRRTRHMSTSAGGDDLARPLPDPMSTSRILRSTASALNQSDCVISLHHLNLRIRKGTLVGICGKYGSGKSSLLAAILGQMKLVAGEVFVADPVAYVAQQAFILNASVKENILFGSVYDEERYQTTIRVCQLSADLTSFPSGDETEIGERGINLSGGQKQRLSLARAVYANREIHLLDDVLSAVDVSVGRHIFINCIKSQLKSKTILLVTHQLQYLEYCDEVLFMKAGRIDGHGSHSQLMTENNDYSLLINSFKQATETHQTADNDDVTAIDPNEENHLTPPDMGLEFGSGTSIASVLSHDSQLDEDGRLVQKESRTEGQVDWSVYKAYIQSAGGILMTSLVLLLVALNVASSGVSNWWLSYWMSKGSGNESVNNTELNNSTISDNPNLGFYNQIHAGILALIVITSLMRSLSITKCCLHASSRLHDSLFVSVMRGTMAFFDTTPVGRILNRFARDLDDADHKLPPLIESSLQNFLRTVMAVVIICIVFPYLLLVVVPLVLLFIFIQRVFRSSIRELKRLESLSRSPLVSHVISTVQGLYTLKAYQRSTQYGHMYRQLQDKNAILLFLHNCAKRWLTIRLDLVATSVTCCTAVFTVIFRETINPAFAGLALTYAIQMTGLLQFMLRMVMETEASFTAVERMDDYTQNIESEEKTKSPFSMPPSWPSAGHICLEGVRMRYRPGLPFVLRNINVEINPGEKIGIVGRTGSGKSSLCLALFRLVELSSGKISIDGIDVADVTLHQLRSRLAIIPQEPVLFAGTVRYNVDPFSVYNDEDVWNALHQCHISPKIKSLPGKLQYLLAENGGNFSVGERQLICLARALLRNSKILIMDEATASVDAVTDALVHETIKASFLTCTVLIIAHRLNTVNQCHKILVLKRGKVVEFDTPQNLLANQKSVFSHMTIGADLLS